MKHQNGLKRLFIVSLVLLTIPFLIQCGSGTDTSEDKKPKVYKINIPDLELMYPAFALPSGISANGRVAYGTIYELQPVGFLPVFGFRWTREGGTVLFDDVPGYKDLTSLATHSSDDGRVIIGIVYHHSAGQYIPWVWQEGKGYKIIDLPADADNPKLHGITADGKIVFGSYVEDIDKGIVTLFIWSEDKGAVSFNPYGHRFINVVCMIDDGKGIVFNSYDTGGAKKHRQGPNIFRVKNREDWFDINRRVQIIPPPIDLVENYFYATDYSSMPFWLSACSKDGSVIGGCVLKDYLVEKLVHPAVWLSNELRLVYLSGVGYNGYTTAVSPDGKWVSYSSHFAVGSDYSTIWNASFGRKELYELLAKADKYYSTNLLEGWHRYGLVSGFSQNNNTIVGGQYVYDSKAPMFGFVIDNFDSVIKAQ